MQKSFLGVVLASSVALAGCASTPQNGDIAQGAAIGAAGGGPLAQWFLA